MAVRIRKFDPTSIKESRILFLIGRRGSGKSSCLKDILYRMPRPDYCVAMAPTEDTLNMFREFLPETCIFDHFSQEKLERVCSLQRELVNRGKVRKVLIILDDCMYQKGVLKSTSMRSIFFNGRHDNISLICCAQYLMDIECCLRTNIDYVFTMRENILINRQKLHKNFFGQFSRFEEFDKVMTACTDDYKTLVLDGTITSVRPTDSVMWYKASLEIPKFKLCKPIFWTLSKKYGIPDEEVRRAQTIQFEIENAVADVTTTSSSAATKRCNNVVIEDESGNILQTS